MKDDMWKVLLVVLALCMIGVFKDIFTVGRKAYHETTEQESVYYWRDINNPKLCFRHEGYNDVYVPCEDIDGVILEGKK